jgi:hypothetical protein
MRPIVWSYGGGTQSIAIALLIAEGRLPKPDMIVFADTGREASETFEYTDAYVAPLLATIDLKIETATHALATVDLYGKKGDLLIPSFTQKGKLPTFCSNEWKSRVVHRFIGGAKANPNGVVMWLGMSTDEVERLKPSDTQWIEHHWPLCSMPVSAGYGVSMSRAMCKQHILDAGWPEPPKSSCWMCPHRRNAQWQRLKEHYPVDFAKAVQLDKEIRAKDTRGGVWLHDSHRPLDEVDFTKEDDQPSLFGCDSGFCWT